MTACPEYEPLQQDQLKSGPFGGLNCLTCATAIAGDYHSCGKTVPTGRRIRELTGDTSGGTTLTQTDDAMRRGYGIDLDVHLRMPRADFWRRIENGQAAALYVQYRVFLGTKFAGSNTFAGVHGITITDATATMARRFDPLCDGRRGFADDGPRGQWVPRSLIDRAMDALQDDHGRIIGKQGSQRFAWAGFTRDNEPNYVIDVPKGASYAVYYLNAKGHVRARSAAVAAKGHYTGTSSGPTRRLIDKKELRKYLGASVRLVEVKSGHLRGKWINAQNASPA